MGVAESLRAAAAVWEIATPPTEMPSKRMAGVRMAGFRERTPGPVELHVVPYPAVTVIVDLGDGLRVDHPGGRHRDTVVAGMAPGTLRGGGSGVECLQIRLSPSLAHAVLGPTSAVATLSDHWGRDAARLQERLRATASWDERFAIAREALTRRLERGRAADPEVRFVWRELVARGGLARVEELADEAGWSRQRLWTRFRAQVGLSPKRAAQLVRFDRAAHRLAAGHHAARVAAECGHADQAHLHRDVRSFAGATPAALAAAPWLAVDDVAWG